MREKRPHKKPDPLSETIRSVNRDGIATGESNAEQVQLENLQEIEKRFQTVFEAAPIGIAVANPDGYFLEVNDAFIKMLGYSYEEIGRITSVDITHPDDRAETLSLSQAVRDGNINFYRTEKRYLKKDGNVVWAVEVDRGQIGQVLLNLFVNSWQAMPTGGDIFIESKNVILKEEDWGLIAIPGSIGRGVLECWSVVILQPALRPLLQYSKPLKSI